VEHDPITEVWGCSSQWGLGVEPLDSRNGFEASIFKAKFTK